jgi:drug/metabolite transporter (DMT)-like permease
LILGFVLLGERLNVWQVLACIIIFFGVLISQDRSAEQEKDVSVVL